MGLVRSFNKEVRTMITLKRAYQKASSSDGTRVLVDRLWPRGVSKDKSRIKLWLKDVAPSNELRKWFHERPSMWEQFRERYLKELADPAAVEALEKLAELNATRKKVTFVFAAKDQEHNNAVVLKQLLEGTKKPPHKVKREPAAASPIAAQRSR
jgi:uncharacterized protein YeaO (DUF488 family)